MSSSGVMKRRVTVEMTDQKIVTAAFLTFHEK